VVTADPAEGLDGESLAWLRRLGAGGGDRQAAELGLHARLVRIALAEVRRRRAGTPVSGQKLDDVAHRAADGAMLAILAKLGDFRGESRFITWAYLFVILEVAAKTGRHYWRDTTVPLDAGQRDRLTGRLGTGPRHAGCREMTAVLHVYADLTGTDAAARYPGVAAHLAVCGPCAADLAGLVLAVTGEQLRRRGG
jgi:RNA polymerase sigma-70 factor (ECF subfamily)